MPDRPTRPYGFPRGAGPLTLVLLFLAVLPSTAAGQAGPTGFPTRVLLTNDNGIDDVALVELARAFARVPGTEVTVVAASRDRSGTTNYMGALREGLFRVERRDLGPGIEAWALDGYPADCVVFALTGPLRERPPDLVVSGINGGPNLADDWFGSGTIGAARTAAYFGIPAVAVSGVENDHPPSVEAVADWVVRFARSDLVASLRAPEYLTVSLPVGTPPEIRGVRIVERARGLVSGTSSPVAEEDGPGAEAVREGPEGEGDGPLGVRVWRIELSVDPARAGPDTDVRAVAEGFIAVVPMRADESDPGLARRLRALSSGIPEWVPPQTEPAPPGDAPDPADCPDGVGVVIDDAEDERGREWGVLMEAVSPEGAAHAAGLRAGDVVVSLDGTALESPRGDPENPDDRFARLFRALPCGAEVELEYVRGTERRVVRLVRGRSP